MKKPIPRKKKAELNDGERDRKAYMRRRSVREVQNNAETAGENYASGRREPL